MAWNKQHKQSTKQRILTSAAQLFTRFGFEQITIDQIMKNAALTRGAFYAHFSSKSDLYSQALITAGNLAKNQHYNDEKTENSSDAFCQQNKMTGLIESYLHPAHRDQQVTHLCPLAFLVTDINQQDQVVKNTYTELFKHFVSNAKAITNDEQKALQTAVLMIGGLAVAKALNDEQLSDEILTSCQQAIQLLAQTPANK